ncbi:hypothetical protein [Candidatus Aquiluna sp. UB-MaderosW2red]|uniref:hypothetical protein n=1 Tax=Candidatus Aquiluna sp. UB-MaderosW2red TaxID=1855377 RepID=UPI0012FAFD4E|nr:hypothetical protein [Candidatus Aquiluna sp. UB-MaderosW2red]
MGKINIASRQFDSLTILSDIRSTCVQQSGNQDWLDENPSHQHAGKKIADDP